MGLKTFDDLLLDELSDLLSAENQIVKSLPKVEKGALNADLKKAFKNHLKETKNQVTRLKKIFKLLKKTPKKKVCKAMEGILKEAGEVLEHKGRSSVKDAALIGAAQRVEHYEIAAYGTAKAHAKLLNYQEIVDLLEETEDEESAADKKLTKIADGTFFSEGVNVKALESIKSK